MIYQLAHAIGLGPLADLIALRWWLLARKHMGLTHRYHPSDLAYANQRIRELGGQ